MPRTVQARLDARAEADLRVLLNQGHTDSEAIRIALREAAERRRSKPALRAEAEAIANDPEDRAHSLRILAEMDEYGVPWPED